MFDINSNPNLSKIAHLVGESELPDYVTSAALDNLGLEQEISPQGFAARIDGKNYLPCHTKAACVVSRAYFEVQRPTLDDKLAARISAKLGAFESNYGIETEITKRIQKVASIANKAAVSPDFQALLLERQFHRNPLSYLPSELIAASRELKTAGVVTGFTREWLFDQPLRHVAHITETMAKNREHPKIAEIGSKIAELPPRHQNSKLGELADELFRHEMSHYEVKKILNDIPRSDSFDIRLLNQDVPRSKVAAALDKIDVHTDLSVKVASFNAPKANWDEIIEQAEPHVQRRILDLL